MRSYAASGGPGTYPHPHELHPGYDPMDPSDFERTYQQRPVDLGYNRSYSPNPVAAIAASASVSEGWTHPLAVTNSDWIDSRVGQHAGIPWPPYRYLRFYERSEQCFSLNFSAKMQNCKKSPKNNKFEAEIQSRDWTFLDILASFFFAGIWIWVRKSKYPFLQIFDE